MAKINYYSANEPSVTKNFRRFFVLPCKESFYRGINRIDKKLRGGLLPFPQNIHIEVTNNCNLRCVMCPVHRQTRKRGFMDFKIFEKVVAQCKNRFHLEKMALMGFGEPFLHPEIVSMSRYAKKNGIRHVFTSTNATRFNERLSADVVLKSGFDLISFSMDGATKETYEAVRVNAEFEKVINNIRTFLEIRRKYKKVKPVVNMQILVMKETRDEVNAFIRFWDKLLGARDIIFIRDVDTFGAQVEDRRLDYQRPRIRRSPCLQLWRDFVIAWDGSVTVCCKDVLYKLRAGNIFENSIEEIWKNKRWEAMRRAHRDRRWNEILSCKNCSEWNQ